MTLDTAHSKEIYQGNGSTTEFPFFFKVWDAAQIAVTVTDAAGSSVDVTTQCAIALNDGGGSVGYLHAGAPLPVGATLAITRNMPFTQGVDLVSASRFDPQVIEDALDQATAERQQTLEMMQRAVILPATSAETPQDVVRAVYAARDDAQTANSEAQAAMNTAANSATAAAASAAGAAGDADLARRWASEAEDVPVQAGEFSARHYSEKAKEAVPENLVGRVETLEGRTAPATTTSRGICRVATLADMEPGSVVENGPAVLAAGSETVTTTPTAHAVPQAGEDGKLDGWVSLDGKANNDLSNLEPAADDVIRSKMALRTLGTRETTGSWTITDVDAGLPLLVFVVGYAGGASTYVRLIPQSNLLPTGDLLLGARSAGEGYALGLSAIYVPSSDTVVISVTSIASGISLVAKQ